MVKCASCNPVSCWLPPGSPVPPPPSFLPGARSQSTEQRGNALEAMSPAHCPRQPVWPLSRRPPGQHRWISSPARKRAAQTSDTALGALRGEMLKQCASKVTAAKCNLGPGNPRGSPKQGARGRCPPGTPLVSLCPAPESSLPLSPAGVSSGETTATSMEQRCGTRAAPAHPQPGVGWS